MKVRELLSDERRWTTGAHARDSAGQVVCYTSLDAVCFCLAGAVRRCYPVVEAEKILLRMHDVLAPTYGSTPCFNDDPKTSFTDILKFVEEMNI